MYADGPTDSPHRYAERGRTKLCLWLPGDTRSDVGSVDDGLLALFGIAAHHLFKETWWRETGEWLGEEAPHDDDIRDQVPAASRRAPGRTRRRGPHGRGEESGEHGAT